ncbi:hypothetical protein BDW74DRAFT_124990 [Aspergillus multicolor]|uniref:uncharacterized protein n=1 Tax=Aspergillus multicolor TaxID=41759 RepID=UPI003CCD6E50
MRCQACLSHKRPEEPGPEQAPQAKRRVFTPQQYVTWTSETKPYYSNMTTSATYMHERPASIYSHVSTYHNRIPEPYYPTMKAKVKYPSKEFSFFVYYLSST